MAGDTGIFATTAEVQMYVPGWASATYNEEAHINQFISFWESYINCYCGYNFSDDYAGLASSDVKRLLSLFVVANVVMDICSMDISGTEIRVAEFFHDRMTDVANKAQSQLKEDVVVNLIKDEG